MIKNIEELQADITTDLTKEEKEFINGGDDRLDAVILRGDTPVLIYDPAIFNSFDS